jgi:hypothetical protein
VSDFPFLHAGYRRLLRFIGGELGRPLVPLRDAVREGPFVILRHDVDFSLDKAREMAELDHEAGARSTFFILLTTPYYNPFCAAGVRTLREIAALGHEIGLHYDASEFEAMPTEARRRRVALRAGALADAVGVPVTSIAQHKPASSGVRETFPDFRDAYDPRWCREIGYLSDSRMRWGQADVEGFFRAHTRSQLLVHPVWWSAEGTDRAGAFRAVRDGVVESVETLLRAEADSIEHWLRARAEEAGPAEGGGGRAAGGPGAKGAEESRRTLSRPRPVP